MQSVTKSGSQSFSAKIVGAKATGDHLECVLTWNGGVDATLVEVRDNSKLVPIVATPGTGRIEIAWDSSDTGSHYVECELEFPGMELRKLKLVGRKGTSGQFDELDSSEAEKDRWRGQGVIP